MFRISSFVKAIAAIALAFLLTLFAYPALAGQASLAWNSSASTNVTGYKIHYGTASGSYSTHIDVGSALSATVPSLTAGSTYFFAVTAYNSAGESGYSNEASATIPAAVAAPVAAFSASATTGTAPLASAFTSTSSGTNSTTTYAWNFGDGTSAAGASANKTYSTAGTYTVSLVATNNPGGSSAPATRTVTVTAPVTGPLAADFSANRVVGAVPLRVPFSETDSGTVATRLWNFGDGTTSTEANPVHTYRKPGSFTVSLTVSGPAGSKTQTKAAYVKAVAANDLVADFGPANGIWSFKNGSTWSRMDTRSARQMTLTDVDHNGASDVLVDLGTDALGASLGLWRLSKDGVWAALDPRSTKNMVTGDFDGNGQDDQVFDFGSGTGLWLLANGSDWSQIDPRTAKRLLLADLDRDGRDELIADFGAGVGIWSNTAASGWKLIDTRTSTWMIAADLDGNDQVDLVADFGAGTGAWGSPNGVWARLNGSTWFQIDPRTAKRGAAVNPDGNAKEELALHYSGDGIYLYSHTTAVGANLTAYVASNWLKISSQAPTRMIAADLNADGKQDLVVDFGSGNANGLWKYSGGSWTKINKKTTSGMVSGQFR